MTLNRNTKLSFRFPTDYDSVKPNFMRNIAANFPIRGEWKTFVARVFQIYTAWPCRTVSHDSTVYSKQKYWRYWKPFNDWGIIQAQSVTEPSWLTAKRPLRLCIQWRHPSGWWASARTCWTAAWSTDLQGYQTRHTQQFALPKLQWEKLSGTAIVHLQIAPGYGH